MSIELPHDGWHVLSSFIGSPIGVVLVLLVLSIMAWGANQEQRLIHRPQNAMAPSWFILLMGILTWLVLEWLIPVFSQSLYSMLTILVRNSFVLIIAFVAFPYLTRSELVPLEQFTGRIQPLFKLTSFGIACFLLMGAVFWLISVVYPYTVHLREPLPGMQTELLTLVLAGGLIPLTEEILFRSLVYRRLRASWGATLGIVTTSVLFAGSHGVSPSIPFIAVGGLGMNLLFEYTDSILPGLCLHAGFNLLLFSGGWFV